MSGHTAGSVDSWSAGIFGRACALEARVDGEGLVAAASAVGVAGVPIEELAGFCVGGG